MRDISVFLIRLQSLLVSTKSIVVMVINWNVSMNGVQFADILRNLVLLYTCVHTHTHRHTLGPCMCYTYCKIDHKAALNLQPCSMKMH